MGGGFFFRAVIKAFDMRQYDSLSFTEACIYWLWNIAPKRTQSFDFMSIYFIWSYFLLVSWRNYDQIVKKVQFWQCHNTAHHAYSLLYTLIFILILLFAPQTKATKICELSLSLSFVIIRTLSIQIPHDFDWLWF